MSEPTPEEELMNDMLDDVLDTSAPAPLRISDADARTMVAQAREEVRPAQPRAKKAAIATGVLALLMAGGAGVATADSDWSWIPGLENPDHSYTYTSPTWGECEIRFSGLDGDGVSADAGRVIDDWFRNTDLRAAVEPLVPGYTAPLQRGLTEAMMPDETGVASDADPRTADLIAWQAREQAVQELLFDELEAQGVEVPVWTSSFSQLNCDDADWGDGE
jgi:hypothetical protein